MNLAGEIGRRYPDVRAVIYPAYLVEEHAELLHEPNVWGYLLKSEPPRTVVEAVRAVARGERYRTEWR